MSSATTWDDLRLCLVLGRMGTLSATGQFLGVSHTTVLRRIASLEARLGSILFCKHAGGYSPTDAGLVLIEAATEVESNINSALAGATGQDKAMRGVIKLSVPDLSGPTILALVREFCRDHPEITIHFNVDQSASGLTTGEAHVALVNTTAPPPAQLGFSLGPAAFGIYAASSVASTMGADEIPWVGFDPSLHHTQVGRLDRHLAIGRPVTHVTGSLMLHYSAIRQGMGMGLLPCGIGDADLKLQRYGEPFLNTSSALWVLYRRELKSSARVSAFAQFLRKALAQRRPLLAGETPLRPPLAIGLPSDLPVEPIETHKD